MEGLALLGLLWQPDCILTIYFDLLSRIQLLQVLAFLCLDGPPVEFSKLRSSERDNLVTVLGRLLDHRIPQQSQLSQTDECHKHGSHIDVEIPDQVVVQVESDQIL